MFSEPHPSICRIIQYWVKFSFGREKRPRQSKKTVRDGSCPHLDSYRQPSNLTTGDSEMRNKSTPKQTNWLDTQEHWAPVDSKLHLLWCHSSSLCVFLHLPGWWMCTKACRDLFVRVIVHACMHACMHVRFCLSESFHFMSYQWGIVRLLALLQSALWQATVV